MKQTIIKKTAKMGLVIGAATLMAGTAMASFSTDAKEAIANNDYNAFVAAVVDTRGENITEERFDTIVEFHAARESGDTEKLAELKEERKADREEKQAQRSAILESGDYDAFAANVPEGRDVPSEEVFNLMIEMHEARELGDKDAMTEIKTELKELGFEKPGKKGHGFGKEKRGANQ